MGCHMPFTSRTSRSIGFNLVWTAALVSKVLLGATGAKAQSVAAPSQGGAATEIVERYCALAADPATEARHAYQASELKRLKDALETQRQAVEARIAELKSWVERRDRFVEMGKDALAKIFSTMRPDAASQQLMRLDDATAAALLLNLKPREASAILNDMDPQRAARLTMVIAGASRTQDSSKAAAAAEPQPVSDADGS